MLPASNLDGVNVDPRRGNDESDAATATVMSCVHDARGKFPNWMAIPLFSAVLLVPCFWQSRIQATDLSSHIYNAWLASQIHRGAAPGLWIAPQSNNVLFDLVLEWLLVHVGANAAQRIAVSASVLVFGWGTILFISRAARRNWWFAAPCVAMLSYGFIFHIGFFNFYLSMGLCLWYLAIFWETSWRIRAATLPLLIVAWLAHPFPVVWAVGISGYIALAKRFQPRRRYLIFILGLAVLIGARYILIHRYKHAWSWQQIYFATGANQINVFGTKYLLPYTCLLFIWLLLFRTLVKTEGIAAIFMTIPAQLWLLNAAAILLLPDAVMFPQFALPFSFIVQRLSLGAAVMLCAVLVSAPIGKFEKLALVLVAILFFALLYSDHRELNQLEDRIDAAISQLPHGQRVINTPSSNFLRSFSFHHDLDRACIDHCFSYANYEPSTLQFRIRAKPGNGIVMDNYADVAAVEAGSYVVRANDLPVYLLYECGAGNVCVSSLQAGDTAGKRH
jgi:hypothetical protein